MAKGVKTGGGSRKGAPNKATAEIRAMIEGALSAVGGQKYLEQQAKENPVAFMNLVGKIIPKEIDANIKGVINFTLDKTDQDA